MKTKFTLLVTAILISVGCNALNYYWVGGSGNWSDYSHHWATSSGGSIFHNQVPQSTDNVFFDASSFTATGQVVTVDQTVVHCADMTWTGVTHNPTFEGSTGLQIYGSLALANGLLFSFSGELSFEATATGKTITTNSDD